MKSRQPRHPSGNKRENQPLDLNSYLRDSLQIDKNSESYLRITKSFQSARDSILRKKQNGKIDRLYFDMDGVIAAEVLSQTFLTKVIYSFFDHQSSCKGKDCFDGASSLWLNSLFEEKFKVKIPEEMSADFVGFLCDVWKGLHEASDLIPSNDPLLDKLSFGRLEKFYQARKTTHNLIMIEVQTKWIFESSSMGHQFCANVPPLPIGIETFKELHKEFPEIGILTSVPDPYRREQEIVTLLGEPSGAVLQLFEKMDCNNTEGKKLWVSKHLDFVQPQNVLICVKGISKEAKVKESNGSDASLCALVDDLKKNTTPFGQNGYLVPSCGEFEIRSKQK